MLLRPFSEDVRRQNRLGVGIDLVIGVFVRIQVPHWNEANLEDG